MSTEPVGKVLFGKTRQAVLGLLMTRPHQSFHLREIVRLTRSGTGAVQREMAGLAAAGLVTRTQRGRQVLYAANTDSPVFEDLRNLTVKTGGLGDPLRAALEPLQQQIDVALLFGSFADGTHRADSDVDLLVISARLSFQQVLDAVYPLQARLGREINPILYAPREFADKLSAGHHFLQRVIRGPRLMLIGDENDLERLGAQWLAEASHSDRQ